MLIYCAAVSAVQSLALARYKQWQFGTEVKESPFQTTAVLFFFLAQYTILNIYRAFIYPRFVSPLRHIPGPNGGHFFFGQAINLFRAPTPTSLYTEWSREHPDAPLLRYLGVGGGEVLVLNSPEAFRDVLQTHCYAFTKPDRLRHMTRPFAGKGLGMLEFDEHKAHRRMMNAAFTPENVRWLEPVFQQKACELGDLIGQVIDDFAADGGGGGGGGVIDCTETFNKATMDVICVALFGIDPDNIGRDNSNSSIPKPGGGSANEKGQYSFRDAYNTIFAMNAVESALMLADSFVPLRWLPCEANRKFKTTTTWLNTTLRQLIRERRNDMVSAKAAGGGDEQSRDILAHLIEQSLPGGSAEGMEDEYMVGHLLFLLLAGHDTSSNALSWSAYTMATNPDIQDKLRREVVELLSSLSKHRKTTTTTTPSPSSSGGISSSSLPSFAEIDALPYLHNFVREVLRVYPPAAIMFRQATAADVTIQGVRIPKGTSIDLVPAVASMDRAVWGVDADAVRPERWEESSEQLAYAYEVFGNGPRICVGKQFALVEIKTFLFAMVSRFRFVGVEGDGFTVENPSFVLRPAGMRVRVEKV
ncbi:cytochrome P450 [Apiospora arundinis]|uniref:Cytochrome P450 n=1 Tax=Apiospora arundinis TaxID=335852 RepID=A0ABR2I8R6_9PEZI